MSAQGKKVFQNPLANSHSTHLPNFCELKLAKIQTLRCQFLDDIKGNLSKIFLSKSEKWSSEIHMYFISCSLVNIVTKTITEYSWL